MSPLYCNDGTFLKSDTTIFHGEVDISDESLPHYKKNTRANECLIWLLLNVYGRATAAYKVIPSTPDPMTLIHWVTPRKRLGPRKGQATVHSGANANKKVP